MVADYVLYKARNREEAFPVEAEISAEEQPSEASNKEFREQLMDMLNEPVNRERQRHHPYQHQPHPAMF